MDWVVVKFWIIYIKDELSKWILWLWLREEESRLCLGLVVVVFVY